MPPTMAGDEAQQQLQAQLQHNPHNLRPSFARKAPGRYHEEDVGPLNRPPTMPPRVPYDPTLAEHCAFPSLPLDYPGLGPSERIKAMREQGIPIEDAQDMDTPMNANPKETGQEGESSSNKRTREEEAPESNKRHKAFVANLPPMPFSVRLANAPAEKIEDVLFNPDLIDWGSDDETEQEGQSASTHNQTLETYQHVTIPVNSQLSATWDDLSVGIRWVTLKIINHNHPFSEAAVEILKLTRPQIQEFLLSYVTWYQEWRRYEADADNLPWVDLLNQALEQAVSVADFITIKRPNLPTDRITFDEVHMGCAYLRAKHLFRYSDELEDWAGLSKLNFIELGVEWAMMRDSLDPQLLQKVVEVGLLSREDSIDRINRQAREQSLHSYFPQIADGLFGAINENPLEELFNFPLDQQESRPFGTTMSNPGDISEFSQTLFPGISSAFHQSVPTNQTPMLRGMELPEPVANVAVAGQQPGMFAEMQGTIQTVAPMSQVQARVNNDQAAEQKNPSRRNAAPYTAGTLSQTPLVSVNHPSQSLFDNSVTLSTVGSSTTNREACPKVTTLVTGGISAGLGSRRSRIVAKHNASSNSSTVKQTAKGENSTPTTAQPQRELSGYEELRHALDTRFAKYLKSDSSPTSTKPKRERRQSTRARESEELGLVGPRSRALNSDDDQDYPPKKSGNRRSRASKPTKNTPQIPNEITAQLPKQTFDHARMFCETTLDADDRLFGVLIGDAPNNANVENIQAPLTVSVVPQASEVADSYETIPRVGFFESIQDEPHSEATLQPEYQLDSGLQGERRDLAHTVPRSMPDQPVEASQAPTKTTKAPRMRKPGGGTPHTKGPNRYFGIHKHQQLPPSRGRVSYAHYA